MSVSINPFETIERKLDYINAKLDAIAGANLEKTSERWLTVPGAAQYTGYSTHTIYKLKTSNRIPFHQRGKKLLFLESELSEWLQGHNGEAQ